MKALWIKAIAAAAAIALSVALLSCVQATQPDLRSSQKTFTSVSFLMADNLGLLDQDYVAHWNASRQIWMPAEKLPWDADISALKMRFTQSAGASVSVAGIAQVSGSTVNDFFGGVSYTITAENESSMEHRVVLERETRPPSEDPLGLIVTVMSYNAEMFEGGSVPASNGAEGSLDKEYYDNIHAKMATMIKNAEADIIIFTETSVLGPSDDIAPLQAALALIGWEMPHVAKWNQDGSDPFYMQDFAILSRYEIISSKTVLEPPSSTYWPRPGLQAIIRVEHPTSHEYVDLTVLGFHLKAQVDGLTKRLNQSHELANYFRSTYASTLTSQYFLVAGDMNTVATGDRGSTTSTMGYLRLLDDADATNDFHAVNEEELPTTWTYNVSPDFSVIDHILLSPALWSQYVSNSIEVRSSDPNVDMTLISDHFPVLLELDL